MGKLPLEGIRIADFSWIIVGPEATERMAMMGAEVIRIESRRRPELLRRVLPFLDSQPGLDRAGHFNCLNIGKKGICLDLTHPKGVALAKEIIKRCDVVAENFAPGVMERLGLGYPALQDLKPDIIMLSGSMLGCTGPDRLHSGWGPTMVAITGVPYISGYPGGRPGRPGGTYPDYMSGAVMELALLAALHHRLNTGQGQFIDFAMAETVMAQVPGPFLDYQMNGRVPERMGNRDPFMAPHNVYRCQGDDQWAAIAVASDEEFRALGQALGHPEWAENPSFADALSRWQSQEALDQLITAWTKKHSPYEVAEILQKAGVAAGPVINVEEAFADPHFQERGFFVEVDHTVAGRLPYAGLPLKLSAAPEPYLGRIPCLGEDTRQVLGELLGISDDEYARLEEEGIVY